MVKRINVPQLVIDLSCNTGALKYGASGFLYGLGNENIPTVNMLAPLKPQVASQKPEGGLQHPNGDAFQVSDTFKHAGGKEIEIYLQDVYAQWPYENLGIADYLEKVENMARQIIAHPNRNMFSYVPLNEPDQIWYNKSDKKQPLFDDWKTLYQTIKGLDATARIVGPNFMIYDSIVYREFLEFARDHACLPEVISWHELDENFFTDWSWRYADYRSIEKSLGIAPREICINEYCTRTGDLGIPGRLVQWIARLEESKVDACLAYWSSAGCLNDLVARDTDNQATGGWWLYKWYGSMTGHTVQVTPSDANAQGLQGLASLDPSKKQVRVLFGGVGGSAEVVIKGFVIKEYDGAGYWNGTVHLVIWAIEFTGNVPSQGPTFVMEGDYVIRDGQVSVTVDGMFETAAYHMILTTTLPRQFSSATPNFYPTVYADIGAQGEIVFVVTASDNGFYHVRLEYTISGIEGAAGVEKILMGLNGAPLRELKLPLHASELRSALDKVNVFLNAGINRITFQDVLNDGHSGLTIDAMELGSGTGAIQTYRAAASENLLSGTVSVFEDSAAPGGTFVGNIGNGKDNMLQFNRVYAPVKASYRMVVHFANAEFRGDHHYNSQIVDRAADIRVNGQAARRVYFRNTFDRNVYRTTVVDVELEAGENRISFSNNAGLTPQIAKIEIAARY